MTKQRDCYVIELGEAVEKLADALDPERSKPFRGDILDLLEWATKDVLDMRQQLAAATGQIASSVAACKIKDGALDDCREWLQFEHPGWAESLRIVEDAIAVMPCAEVTGAAHEKENADNRGCGP